MPFWRLYYHATWGTKDRQPILSDEIENGVYRLITAKAQEMGAIVYAVNGALDHIHIVASVPPSLALADWIREIKGNSSHAINHTHPNASLQWQAGYGILSFGQNP